MEVKFNFYVALCLKDGEVEGVTIQVPHNIEPELTDDLIDSLVVNNAEDFGSTIDKEIIMLIRLLCDSLTEEFSDLNLRKLRVLVDEGKAKIVALNDFKIMYLQDYFNLDDTEETDSRDATYISSISVN